jgi:hypothetical protein
MLWEVISRQAPNQTLLLLGLAFLLIVYVLPGGFVGLYERLKRAMRPGGRQMSTGVLAGAQRHQTLWRAGGGQ